MSTELRRLYVQSYAALKGAEQDLDDWLGIALEVAEELQGRRERLEACLNLTGALAVAVGREVSKGGEEAEVAAWEAYEERRKMASERKHGCLSDALAAAQSKMKNPRFNASSTAFGGRTYRYATLAAVRDEVVPVLACEGIAVTQQPTVDGNVLCLTTSLLFGEERLDATLRFGLSKTDPQAVGSALTYARRYSLMAIAGVVGDDDDDGEAAQPAPGPALKAAPAPAPKAATVQLSKEAFEAAIADAADVPALTKVGAELSRAPRELRDLVTPAFQKKMQTLGKK